VGGAERWDRAAFRDSSMERPARTGVDHDHRTRSAERDAGEQLRLEGRVSGHGYPSVSAARASRHLLSVDAQPRFDDQERDDARLGRDAGGRYPEQCREGVNCLACGGPLPDYRYAFRRTERQSRTKHAGRFGGVERSHARATEGCELGPVTYCNGVPAEFHRRSGGLLYH